MGESGRFEIYKKIKIKIKKKTKKRKWSVSKMVSIGTVEAI